MRAELKEKAKKSLKGKWSTAVATVLVYVLIGMVASMIVSWIGQIFHISTNNMKIVSNICGAIVDAALAVGFASFFLKLSRGKKVDYKELFAKNNVIITAIVAMVIMTVFTTLWGLLLIVPGIIAAIRYSQTYFVLADHPEMSATEAINESKRIMDGHKMDYFVLCLSFIGWLVLAVLTLCIGLLWLVPYIQVTCANFYNSIK